MSCNASHPSFRRLTQHRSIPGNLETLAVLALMESDCWTHAAVIG